MRVSVVSTAEGRSLLDPEAAVWGRARAERIRMMGTPVGLQPTAAIRVKWTGKEIGAVSEVRVRALHDGERLAFRLEWSDPSESRQIVDTTGFPDGAAVALPAVEGAPLMTMGAPGMAVNAWYWRADEEQGRHVVAEGLGTSRTADTELVEAHGVWKEGRWRLVLARALRVRGNEPLAQLAPGSTTRFGIAVWEGGRGERAGIKAFSGDWRELVLDPLPSARR